MVSKTLTIGAADGMHARPAGELVKLVKSFAPAKITMATEKKTVDAASLFSVLSLGLKCGTQVTLSVEGGNENMILGTVADFISGLK